MMKNKKTIGLMWALALLPAGMIALCWTRLPAVIPVHWGVDGQVDGYGGKGTLWLFAALSVGMALLFQFLPRIDPKRENYARFQGGYDAFAVVMAAFMAVITAIVLTESLRPGTLNVGKVVMLLVSVLFMGIGCILGKVKPNWFMGIRTPWALSDPDVWNRTHRLGGWIFFLIGAGNIPVTLLCPGKVSAILFFAALMGGTVLIYFMSWKFYREKNG